MASLWGEENGSGEEGGLFGVKRGTLEAATPLVFPKGGRLT